MIRFTDRPEYCPREWYDECLQELSQHLGSLPGIRSVYRFGNISIPGISDLDILLVFENETSCIASGLEQLSAKHKILFTHGIMAMSEQHFLLNDYYTIWSDRTLLAGKHPEGAALERTEADDKHIKQQIALEFLAANYVDFAVQQAYGIFKLRGLLQHTKGLLLDLDFLNIHESPIHEPIQTLREKAQRWFEQPVSDSYLTGWLQHFIPRYNELCATIFAEHPMYLAGTAPYVIAKNLRLENGRTLATHRSGIRLPYLPFINGRKQFKLLNKLNTFDFELPVINSTPHKILEDRFQFLREMKSHNRRNLPNFMTMTTSITSKLI